MQHRIVIANPGRQHSDQLAAALVKQGFEVHYFHGAPIRPSLRAILQGRHSTYSTGRILSWLSTKLLPFNCAERAQHFLYTSFDHKIARIVRKIRPSAVIAYENSAINTFYSAHDVGAVAILDAADVHFAMQNEVLTDFRVRVNMDKTLEIKLADHLISCSTLARDSYVANGTNAENVTAIPLGVDLEQFSMIEDSSSRDGLRILFVGRITRKKGADVLGLALNELAMRGIKFELKVAADLTKVENGMDCALAAHGTLLGKIATKDLPELYAWGDILVVPSRFDSFGLVVYEALACGLPVLVSDQVGSKDIVIENVNGHVVPVEDSSSLCAQLAELSSNLQLLRKRRTHARSSVERADWPDYHRRAGEAVAAIIERVRL